MIEPIWQAAGKRISPDRMLADTSDFYALSSRCSYDAIYALAELIADRMRSIGLQDVRLIDFQADGRSFYGGWAMPKAYDVRGARLVDMADGSLLADYAANPISLMLYSMPTPPDGAIAEVVVADSPEQITAERASGKLVLTSGIGVAFGLAAIEAEAAGLVSDCRQGPRFIKDGAYLDGTTEWHNYTIPPWDLPNKGFGFSITPTAGRELRERLAGGERVRLRAFVDTRHYDGRLPVISGLLPGRLPEETALTGHYDEFGADDNCSQVAAALETARCVKAMAAAGEIPALERSLRILLPMEVRGFNALVQRDEEVRNLRAGLNIDTVGTDQNRVTASCSLTRNFAAAPSFGDDLAAYLLDRVQRDNPLFRWHVSGADTIDNVFSDPLIGAPTPAIYHYSGTHHLNIDTPDRISPRMLFDMARLATTYMGLIITAGLQEARWLMEVSADRGQSALRELATEALRGDGDTGRLLRRLRADCNSACARLDTVGWIAPARREELTERAAVLKQRLEGARQDAEDRIKESTEYYGAAEPTPLSECAVEVGLRPRKAFRGFAAFENLDEAGRGRLRGLGIEMGWGAPVWVQQALFFANGDRPVAAIATLLADHGAANLEVPYLERVFDFLAEIGMVELLQHQLP